MQCEPEECRKLILWHSLTNMVYSSLQLEASVAFLILYFLVFDCSSSPLYASGTNSKMTSMNGTINVDYHQSLSHDRNEYISTNKTSHGAEAKPQSYININQNKVTFSMGEETSLTNHINNNPATDGTRNSRRFSRSEGTGSCNLKTRPNISREIKKWISYVASCSDESSSKCHDSCSVNSTEVCCYFVHIHLYTWKLGINFMCLVFFFFVRTAVWIICEFIFMPIKWNLLFAFRKIYSWNKNMLLNICCILTWVTPVFIGLFVHEKFSWPQTEDLFDSYNLRQHMYTIVLVL